MKELIVFYAFMNDNVIVFSTKGRCIEYIFKINKDFKIDSYKERILGYSLDLTEILDLKQFKVEIS